MEHKGFSYEFTFKEAIYLLFKKKICPKCGCSLSKEKIWENRPGAELNSKADPIFVPNIKVKSYKYYFTCEKCGTVYTLNELSNIGKEK